MKPIVCLETTWYPNSPITVRPFLETLRMLEGVPYTYYYCSTVDDLKHFLTKKQGKPGILYIAVHGKKGRLAFAGRDITLQEMSEMMGKRFKGWTIHFASCETLNTSDRIFQEFKAKTGAGVVCGYTKQVDWIEGYALDMLLMQKAQTYLRNSFFIKSMYNNYSDLITRTGLYLE